MRRGCFSIVAALLVVLSIVGMGSAIGRRSRRVGGRGSVTFRPPVPFGEPQIGGAPMRVPLLKNVAIVDFSQVVFRGSVDLNPALNRIRIGRKLPHRNDGAIFTNRERRIPFNADREYYREFVIPTDNVRFPGPQRMVLGKGAEVYYTGDHYASFERANR